MPKFKGDNIPKPRKNRVKRVSQELVLYDPYEMDPVLYELIVKMLSDNGIKAEYLKQKFVNELIPGKPRLYSSFLGFKSAYERIKRIERKQAIMDDLNSHLDNMEEHTNLGLSILKRSKKGKTGKDSKKHKYSKYFEVLDSKIEYIQELIMLCVPPKRIITELVKNGCLGLNLTIFYYWKDETKYIEELQFAYKSSADEHMYLAKEFMEDWLNRPNLDMQHVGIVREIGLYHSRMADFLNRKKWGKQVTITDDKPIKKVLSGGDITHFLQNLQAVADAANGIRVERSGIEEDEDVEQFEERMRQKGDEDDFVEYEEVK